MRPCALVACIGTTGTTAVDSLARIADIAERYGLWLHVDAAMAGTAMVLPECRAHFAGVEQADSLVFNPHKWMGVGFDFSAYYVRDPEHLIRVMSTNPSYLQTEAGRPGEELPGLAHPARQALPLAQALVLSHGCGRGGPSGPPSPRPCQCPVAQGSGGRRRRLGAACARPLPDRMHPPCPAALAGDEDALKAHNLEIARRINEGGRAYLTPSILKDKQILRVSIGAETTERAEVEALWALLNEAAARTD